MGHRETPTAIQALHFLTIGSFPSALAEDLAARISRRVSVPCRIVDTHLKGELPILPDREQVDADALLNHLEELRVAPGTVIVGITLRDLGIRIFTFVFGQARYRGRVAVVSLARLKPGFYGLAPDPALTVRRAVMEILHELGHIAGLTHCANFSCLMHFATNVESIDLRGGAFCEACRAELPEGFWAPDGTRMG